MAKLKVVVILKEWLRRKNESIFFLTMILKKIVTGDTAAVHQYLTMDENPELLHIEHRGNENEGNIVLAISEQGHGYGFFAEFRALLYKLIYAEQMGFLPCVTFGENFLYYDLEEALSCPNSFLYYFEPIGSSKMLEESQNIVFCKSNFADYVESQYQQNGYGATEELEKKFIYVVKKYIRLRKELEESIKESYANMFPDGKVLGIHYRGTDYKVGYNVHPVQAKLEQMEEIIEDELKKRHFNSVFLATDEEGVYEYLKGKFGDRVKCYEDVYKSSEQISVAFSSSDRAKHHYRLGLEVLRDMYTLSMCHGLVAGLSQVSFMANIFKKSREEEYVFMKIIDNGMNQNKVYFKSDQFLKK